MLRKGGVIHNDLLPFDVEVNQYQVNSKLADVTPGEGNNPATVGEGREVLAVARPEIGLRDLATPVHVAADDEPAVIPDSAGRDLHIVVALRDLRFHFSAVGLEGQGVQRAMHEEPHGAGRHPHVQIVRPVLREIDRQLRTRPPARDLQRIHLAHPAPSHAASTTPLPIMKPARFHSAYRIRLFFFRK